MGKSGKKWGKVEDGVLNLLTGEYRNTLDEKGRIVFPSKLRSAIAGNVLVATHSFDNCLWLFTPSEWENVSSKLIEHSSLYSGGNRFVLRKFIAPAQELEFDKSGRISIPMSLREYAHLSKDCVILGVKKYMELWDVDSYKAYMAESETTFQSAVEELSSISF